MLKFKSQGSPYKIGIYNAVFRRPRHINQRFKAKVAEATGHTIRQTEETTGFQSATNNQCSWNQFSLGDSHDNDVMYNHVVSNAAGYGVPEVNTTLGAATRYMYRVKILRATQNIIFMNRGTAPMNIAVYALTPRFDLLVSGAESPVTLLSHGDAGDLQGNATPLSYLDPIFTPFMAPEVTHSFKISRVRHLKVHAGNYTKFNMVSGNYDITPWTDEDSRTEAKVGKAKFLLVKCWGDLVSVGAGPYEIATAPTSSIWKQTSIYEAHVSAETRKITYNVDRPSPAVGASKYIDQESNGIDTFQALDV